MGQSADPNATALLITADGGGSNSTRSRLRKVELEKLADDTGLQITVRYSPPGTGKPSGRRSTGALGLSWGLE